MLTIAVIFNIFSSHCLEMPIDCIFLLNLATLIELKSPDQHFFFNFFRVITKTGMQNLIQHSMAPILPTLKNGDPSSEGGPPPPNLALFDPTSYRSVHNLATNTDKRPFEDLLKKSCEAIFMAKCLKFSGFFGEKETQDTRR